MASSPRYSNNDFNLRATSSDNENSKANSSDNKFGPLTASRLRNKNNNVLDNPYVDKGDPFHFYNTKYYKNYHKDIKPKN